MVQVRNPLKIPTLLFWAIAVSGVYLRLSLYDWGMVTQTGLQRAGYPDSSLVAGPGAIAGGEKGRIYGTLVYDEGEYQSFFPWFSRLEEIWSPPSGPGNSFFSRVQSSYLSAYVRGNLSPSPMAPMGFAAMTALIAHGVYGLPWHDGENWETAFYRFGRLLNELWIIPGLWAFLILWTRITASKNPYWLSAGALAFLFQPVLLSHGRFITYNVAALTLELGLIIWADRFLAARRNGASGISQALGAGCLFGLGLLTKITIAPIGGCALLICLWRVRFGPVRTTALSAWKPMLAFAATCAATVLFFSLPAWMHPEAKTGIWNMQRMLLGLADLEYPHPAALYLQYFRQTLPAAMGWPIYVTGAVGVILALRRPGAMNSTAAMAALSLLALLLLYPSNPLGLEVQRSLSVITFFLLFAGAAIRDCRSRPWARAWGVYLALGLLFSALSTTWYFSRENPGYRFEMAQWMLRNIPAGDTVWVEQFDHDHHSPLSLAETAWPEDHGRLYGWKTGSYSEYSRHGARAWGQYYALDGDRPPAAIFRSAFKKEIAPHRYARMILGYHRWDQIFNQPDFAVFAPSARIAP